MAITVAIRGRFCLVSSCRINHFDMKPVRGGRPPRDNKTRAVVATKIGFFDQIAVRVLIFVADEIFRVRKAADVKKTYMSSARRVRWGAY